MKRASITSKTSVAELGAIVCQALRDAGMSCFLSGGAVVTIYTENRYQSYDLDFVSLADRKKVKIVMEELGFNQDRSRCFIHPKSKFFVEFPGSAIQVGDELVTEFSEIKLPQGTLKLLTPTDCVKDRLAAFYHWNDRQGLEQAVLVALCQPVKLESVKKWSKNEGMEGKYQEFLSSLKSTKFK